MFCLFPERKTGNKYKRLFLRASPVMLQVLYKLKTAKVFEKYRNKEDKAGKDIVDEDPFAIQTISWCLESRMLCVAGVSAHVLIYRFSQQEVTSEVLQVGARASVAAYFDMRGKFIVFSFYIV